MSDLKMMFLMAGLVKLTVLSGIGFVLYIPEVSNWFVLLFMFVGDISMSMNTEKKKET